MGYVVNELARRQGQSGIAEKGRVGDFVSSKSVSVRKLYYFERNLLYKGPIESLHIIHPDQRGLSKAKTNRARSTTPFREGGGFVTSAPTRPRGGKAFIAGTKSYLTQLDDITPVLNPAMRNSQKRR